MLLDHGAIINRRAGSCGSALGSALWSAHFDMAKHLLDMGADPNAASGPLGTGLSFAVSKGEIAMVRLLIERGVEVGKDSHAFAVAATNTDLQMLKLLLAYEGEPPVVTDAHSEAYGSALQTACAHGNLDAARLLLDRGLDPNIGGISLSYNEGYSTPLEAAAFNGNLPVVRLLIERGADINKPGLNFTALSRAVEVKDEQIVTYLLENGARDASLLPVAVKHGSKAFLRQLLEYGMDVNARDDHRGYTALHWAAENGDTDIVSLLLQYKADTSIWLKDGFRKSQVTAIHLAVEHGHIDAAFAILAVQGRSTVNLPDSNGNTPLHLAASAGQSDTVDALLALAETAQMTNHEGETPLHMIALSDRRGRYPEGSDLFSSISYSHESEPAEEQEGSVKIPGVCVVTSLMAFYDRMDIQDKHGITPLMRLAGSSLGKGSGCRERVGDWKVLTDDKRILDSMINHGAQLTNETHPGRLFYTMRQSWVVSLESVGCSSARTGGISIVGITTAGHRFRGPVRQRTKGSFAYSLVRKSSAITLTMMTGLL